MLWLAAVAAMSSCKPTVPRKYIQPDEFEDLLYDYNVALTMVDEDDGIENKARARQAYKLAVLEKHGVTEAEYDSALVYYTRHSDRLYKMYKNLMKRMEDEAVSLGADAREISRYGAGVASGDTANIWPIEGSAVLMPAMPYNVLSYSVETDTTFHVNDRIIWSFDTRFFYQEGRKNAVAMLVLCFSNDSVSTRTRNVSSNSHYTLELACKDTVPLKEVRGFICIANDANASPASLRLLSVNNIRLVKALPKKKTDTGEARHDRRMRPDTTAAARDTAAEKPSAALSKPLIKKSGDSVSTSKNAAAKRPVRQ